MESQLIIVWPAADLFASLTATTHRTYFIALDLIRTMLVVYARVHLRVLTRVRRHVRQPLLLREDMDGFLKRENKKGKPPLRKSGRRISR